MNEKIEIIKITDKNSIYIPLMCEWLMKWWGNSENFSEEKMIYYIKNSISENRIPQTFLALYNGEPAGMYQISMTDIDVRPDIYPWLINVFVSERFRGHGILRQIIKSLHKNMDDLKLDTIYLFTEHENLYEKFGFEFIEGFKTYIKNDTDTARLYRLKK